MSVWKLSRSPASQELTQAFCPKKNGTIQTKKTTRPGWNKKNVRKKKVTFTSWDPFANGLALKPVLGCPRTRWAKGARAAPGSKAVPIYRGPFGQFEWRIISIFFCICHTVGDCGSWIFMMFRYHGECLRLDVLACHFRTRAKQPSPSGEWSPSSWPMPWGTGDVAIIVEIQPQASHPSAEDQRIHP